MDRLPLVFVLAVAMVALTSCSSGPSVPGARATRNERAPAVSWPPLPESGFITGRPATDADVAAGRAGFSAVADGEVIGQPIDIDIPQYAFHLDAASGRRTPGVIIQAEEARGSRMATMRTTTGEYLVGLLWEFELLGTDTPQR